MGKFKSRLEPGKAVDHVGHTLEELEAYLDKLLEGLYILKNLWLDRPVVVDNAKKHFLDVIVLERQILDAYDAIESRKNALINAVETLNKNFQKQFEDTTAYKENLEYYWDSAYQVYTNKYKFEKSYPAISDYEWNWLKSQEEKKDK